MTNLNALIKKFNLIEKTSILIEKTIIKKYVINPIILTLIDNTTNKKTTTLFCGNNNSIGVIENDTTKKQTGDLLGSDLTLGDIATFNFSKIGKTETLIAIFLLDYAKSKMEIDLICKRLYNQTTEGGKIFVVMINPSYLLDGTKKYGISVSANSPLKEGNNKRLTYFLEGLKEVNSSIVYHWKRSTYEKSLRKAGFGYIKWQENLVSKKEIELLGDDFWEDFILNPPIIGMLCCKNISYYK